MLLKFELGEMNFKMTVFTVLLTVGKGVCFTRLEVTFHYFQSTKK